jgi:predicted nucleic acid-binding protein
MIPIPFNAVLDANVLYPFTLRDTLLRAAAMGLFQMFWTDQILEEACRNLVISGAMTREKSMRLRALMEKAFPEAMVTGYKKLTHAMKNQKKDRHIVAAAVKAGAQVIVTSNLKDFRELPEGIEALSPDAFLCSIFDLEPNGMVRVIKEQAADLRKPPRSFAKLFNSLEKLVPRFTANIRKLVTLDR